MPDMLMLHSPQGSRFSYGQKLAPVLFVFWQLLEPATASTALDQPDLCTAAAQNAARQTGVPLPVLLAITLVETGRMSKNGLKPWPWAINQAGKGFWFATPETAIEFAEAQLDLGVRNFDVGCFQLNHRWHSKGFRSTVDMFDPNSNALYAAEFLKGIYDDLGDWSLAAATYHSRTPELAESYRTKFDAMLAGLTDPSFTDNFETAPTPRINHFPLLQVGLQGKAGSLVPLTSTGIRLIGGKP